MSRQTIGLTEQQQAIRARGIGASEVAAVLGLSHWRSPYDVWLDKTRRAASSAMSAAAAWGLRQEPLIAAYYAETHGVEMIEPGTLVHRQHPVAVATLDRIVLGEAREWSYSLQIKTGRAAMARYWGDPGTDEIPEDYLVQVAWEMAVADVPFTDVAVLLDQCDYREYRVARDFDLEEDLIERVERWWRDHVVADSPPPITGPHAEEHILRQHPRSGGGILEATPSLDGWVSTLREARRLKKQAEEAEAAARIPLITFIGDAKGVAGPWGRITYSTVNRKPTVNWEAVARALNPSALLLDQHTTQPAPSRRFLPQFTEEED